MTDRTTRVLLLAATIFLGVLALGPYIDRWLFASTEPRPVIPRGELAGFEKTAIELFQAASPSVVQVVSQNKDTGSIGTGTGFIWDRAGHVVTNDHVVGDGSDLMVRLADGRLSAAKLVGRAPNYDLAVIRLDERGALPPPVTVGSSQDLAVGQAAFAIGNPFGLDQSLTSGIISALERRLPTGAGREIAGVIQTDAAINPGNSGGPLLDSAGRLIGVNTAIFSPSGANAGIGFAIPVDRVNRVVPQLINQGRVPNPGIGIVAADEATTAQLGITGVVVAGVVPGTPAERAGLKGIDQETGRLGDVITAVDDRPVRRLPDLTDRLEEVGVGKPVTLALLRGGSMKTVKVEVADLKN
jgi:2-alkenal reductase